MEICGLISISSIGRSPLVPLSKAILKIATFSLRPGFIVSWSFFVALHLRCLAWIKALANRSQWTLWQGPEFKGSGEFVLLIFTAVTEVSHEVSVNKTGLSSNFSGPVMPLHVVNPYNFMNDDNKMQKCIFLLWPLQSHNIIVGIYNSYLDRNKESFPLCFTAVSDRGLHKTMKIILSSSYFHPTEEKKRWDIHIN